MYELKLLYEDSVELESRIVQIFGADLLLEGSWMHTL